MGAIGAKTDTGYVPEIKPTKKVISYDPTDPLAKAEKFSGQVTGNPEPVEKPIKEPANIIEIDTSLLHKADFNPEEVIFNPLVVKTSLAERLDKASTNVMTSGKIVQKFEDLLSEITESLTKENFKALKGLLGEEKAVTMVLSYKEFPGELKGALLEKIKGIVKNHTMLPERKKELLSIIESDARSFLQRQKEFAKEIEVLNLKRGALTTAFKEQIEITTKELSLAEAALKKKPASPELQVQVEALRSRLNGLKTNFAKTESRTLEGFISTMQKTDAVRFKDMLDATGTSFGPVRSGTAKKVEELLPSIKDAEGKQIFRTPEEVNLAIRRRPSDLSPGELEGLKQLRQEISKIPAEGKVVAKVSLQSKGTLQNFVIEPEYIKGIKSEEELISVLRLDYPGSPFIKNGKPNFKLADIQVTLGRTFPSEAKIPFSREFGGEKSLILYEYPYSGNGFLTSKGGFPIPETDLGGNVISETKVLKWDEFAKADIEKVVPKRTEPVAKPKAENLPPKPEKTTDISKLDKKIVKQIDDLPVEDSAKTALKELAASDSFKKNPTAMENLLKEFKNNTKDKKLVEAYIESLKVVDAQTLVKAFKDPGAAKQFFSVAKGIYSALKKMGLASADIALKVVKGMAKALPVIGGAASAYDAVRLLNAAKDGKYGDTRLDGFEKGDPRDTPENREKLKSLRALAFAGSGLNTADTALAVIETTGIGNVDLPFQIGLAVAEVAVDLAIEYYAENPEKLSPEASKAFKALGLATALVHPEGTEVIKKIYGDDFCTNYCEKLTRPVIAAELTKVTGELALDSASKLGKLSAKTLDKGIDGTVEFLSDIADIIKDPDKYAKAFNKDVEDVIKFCLNKIKNFAAKGNEQLNEALKVLAEIANNPLAYGHDVYNLMVDMGMTLMSGAKAAYDGAIEFIKVAVKEGKMSFEDGFNALKNAGNEGIKAAKKFIREAFEDTWKLGEKTKEFMIEVLNNPKKYGELAKEILAEMKQNIINGSIETYQKFVEIKDKLSKEVTDSLKSIGKDIAKCAETLVKAGNATIETFKYIAENPGDFAKELQKSAVNFFLNIPADIEKGAEIAKECLSIIKKSLALDKFADILSELASKSVETAGKIFKDHWDVIQKRLPDIINAAAGISDAIIEQLNKTVSGKAIVKAMMNLENGFNTMVKIASKNIDVLTEFTSNLIKEFKDAWNKNGLSGIKDLIMQYYNAAIVLANDSQKVIRNALHKALETLDVEVAGDWIPDKTYAWLKAA